MAAIFDLFKIELTHIDNAVKGGPMELKYENIQVFWNTSYGGYLVVLAASRCVRLLGVLSIQTHFSIYIRVPK